MVATVDGLHKKFSFSTAAHRADKMAGILRRFRAFF